MNKRLELHEKLCSIINITAPDGDRHVYFQPPPSVNMKYPCVRYSLADIRNIRADNANYNQHKAYEIILIDANPDSPYVDVISAFPKCRFVRHYTANNLNHYVFNIYY